MEWKDAMARRREVKDERREKKIVARLALLIIAETAAQVAAGAPVFTWPRGTL